MRHANATLAGVVGCVDSNAAQCHASAALLEVISM